MSPSAISQCSALTPSHTQNTFCCQQDILKKGCSATREERNEDWAMLLPPDVDSPHFAEPIFKKKTKQKTKWNSSFGFSFLSTSRKKPEITSIYNFVFGEGSLFLFFFFPKLRVCVSVQQFLQGVSCLPSVTQLFHDVLN